MISKNPDRIPIVIMPNKRCYSIYEWIFSFFIKIETQKLVEKRFTAENSTSFHKILDSLLCKGYKNFQYMDGEYVNMNQNLIDAYQNKKSEDGFLYIKY